MNIIGKNSPSLKDLLSSRIMAKLINVATVMKYSDGQHVHSRGDEKPGLTIVRTGQIRLGNYGLSGDFTPVAVLGPGHTMGEQYIFADLPRLLDCFTVGETELYEVSVEDVNRLADAEPELLRAFLRIETIRLFGCLEFIDDIRRLPLHVRTAKLFISLLDAEQTTIKGSQEELAHTLGVSRVSFGKALKKLVALDFIEPAYRQITVRDVSKLVAWVGQSNEIVAVKADYQKPIHEV